jgi:hypothetical protein
MIKVVSTFKVTPDRPRAEADDHYLHNHVPLVTSVLREIPGALGYVQNRVHKANTYDYNGTEARDVDPIFDWLVEFWFADREARVQMAVHPRMADVMADHVNFMAVDTLRTMEYYVVEEHVAIWRPETRDPR